MLMLDDDKNDDDDNDGDDESYDDGDYDDDDDNDDDDDYGDDDDDDDDDKARIRGFMAAPKIIIIKSPSNQGRIIIINPTRTR